MFSVRGERRGLRVVMSNSAGEGPDHLSGHRKKTYRVAAALPALRAGRTARENIARGGIRVRAELEVGRGEEKRSRRMQEDLAGCWVVAMVGKCEVELLAVPCALNYFG